ncbi:MAG: class I SAM-dependent methyltransferase [Sinobacteraceae bacterium]|nr:class I SAM-dependent methyltransferase [Nevskiaceae bacterium]MBV9913189.1 class I SAM-dependent methyltransferase [Nevskiaceae bacterium]
MNAIEDRVASESGRLRQPHPAPASVPMPGEAARARQSMDARFLERLLRLLGNPPIEFVLWNGERIPQSGAEPVARIRIQDRATLYGLLADPQVRFGDFYSEGRIEVEGDLVRLLEEIYRSGTQASRNSSVLRRLVERMRRRHVNTLPGSRDNIHHHYDIGNAFYSLWLGKTMAYTCAYYPTPTANLDEAQVAKMDHVCRKLRLRPGETVVEAGCGWGTLALHMARQYGVKVRAFNISHEQIAYAREKAEREGLTSQVEYVEDDYRNISGRYDAFVSVGMLEHVGVEHYSGLGRVIDRVLGGRGRGLIHSIGRNRPAAMHPWIEKRIFPGAHPPALSEMMQIFEPWNLSVLDVENIRLHYARTLQHWSELYEGATDRVAQMFDTRFVRMWRLYLAGSVAAFTTGTLQLFQVVFAPGGSNDVPWTRDYIYAR